MKAARDLGERALRAIFEPAMAWLTRRRVHPNVISTLGFVITCSSGYFFHQHHVSTAGFLVLLGGVFDLFDGTVARRTGLASSFGAFYDSTLDRLRNRQSTTRRWVSAKLLPKRPLGREKRGSGR